MMSPHDPGARPPEQWSALCLAAVTGTPLSECEMLYNALSDDEWADYCLAIADREWGTLADEELRCVTVLLRACGDELFS